MNLFYYLLTAEVVRKIRDAPFSLSTDGSFFFGHQKKKFRVPL